MKTTLNPFENAKRIAVGTGGVTPAVIEEMQAEISVLGSQNTAQAQDITDIKTQLTELAGAYSTTEHKTGRKWIDGKDIYEKTIHASDVTLSTTAIIDSDIKSNTVDTLISIIGTALDNEGSLYECYVSSTDRVVPVVNNNGVTLLISNVTVKGYNITIQYTKPTV